MKSLPFLLGLATALHAVANETTGEIYELEDFTVQSEHIERPIWETPNSISLFSGEELSKKNITNLQELIKFTPGVSQNFGGEGITIRGVQQNGVGAGGRLQAITTVVDGVYQPRFNNRIEPFSFFDIGQVEVLKGGQSAFQGRSALAGAVVIHSNDPTFMTEASAEGFAEEGSKLGGNLMLNQPLSETFAVRFSGGYAEGDGHIKNVTLSEDADAEEQTWGRVKLLYSSKESDFTALATLYVSDVETGDDFVDSSLGIENRQITSNLRGREDNQTTAMSLQFDYETDGALSYGGTFTYGDFEYSRFDDDDRTAGGGPSFKVRDESTDQYTAEVHVGYQDDQQKAIIGLYGFNNDIDESFGGQIDFASLSPLVAAGYRDGFIVETEFLTPSESDNYAVFAEYEREINENWSFRLGLRYDYEEFAFSNSQTFTAITPFNGLIPQVDGFLGTLLGSESDSEKTDFDVWLPSASVTRHFGERVNASLLYRRDYRGGGVDINLGDLVNPVVTYDPEFTQTVEFAIRAFELLDGKYDTSLNVYYTYWEDQQVFNTDEAGLGATENVGESELYGIEWSQSWRPIETLELYSSAAYNLTEFIDYISREDDPSTPDVIETIDFGGNEFPYAPEFSLTVGAAFRFGDGFSIDLSANYEDSAYIASDNTLENDSRTLVNASAGYEKDNWFVQTYVSNIFDKDYITNNAANGIVKVGEPRIAGVRAGIRF